ncbi:MAG: hypothetical protein GX462_00210 [Thermotogaceae bacterium]|nr:hypothetical protein [Thermotogaceae bacterium]
MKKGLSLLLIALLLFFTLGLGTEAVKPEDVKVLETLIELMSGKLGEYQDQFKDFKGLLGNLSGKIGDIESKSEALNQMDRWLRTKIEDTEKSLRERITTGEEKLQSAIEEKIQAVTQRLTGIDSGISNLKGEIEAIYQEIYRLGFELFEAVGESGQETTQRIAFIQSQIDLLYKKIKQLEGKDGSGASALDGISSDIALLKEIIGYVDQANVGLWNAASVREKEAEARYEEINLRLKSVENAFIALRSEDADTRNALDEMISGVGLLQQSVASLQANDKFLWNKVDIAERQLAAKVQAGDEQLAQLLTEKVSALNLRLKWVDGSIEKLKGDLKALDKDVLELSAGLERLRKEQASGNGNLSQVIDDRVWAINKRLGWTDGAVAKLKTDLESLQKKLNEATSNLEEETLNRIWGVNKRLMWLENQVSQIKNESGQSQEIVGLSIANLELEVQLLKTRTQTIELEKALKGSLDEMVVAKLNDVVGRCAQIEKQLNVMKTFATKDELAVTNQSVAKIAKETAEKFPALDARLAWIDKTLASQKGQVENLARNLAEVKGSLSEELAERMWAINTRLKWIDGAITKLKSQKADDADMNAKFDAIQGELLGLSDDILALAVAIQKNSEEIVQTKAGLRETAAELTQRIDAQGADIQSQIASMRARLEVSISANQQAINGQGRKIDDLETRVKALEDSVFKKPENTQPAGIILLLAGVAALALLFANH